MSASPRYDKSSQRAPDVIHQIISIEQPNLSPGV